MNDNELKAFLGRKIHDSLNDEGGEVSDVRKENFDYYMGEPFGTERDGHSSVVTRECLETVEWAASEILPAFVSGDRVVSFDAVGPEDEEQAQQETDVVNHLIMKQNDGYLVIHNLVKSILIYPNAYVKAWMEEKEQVETETYTTLNLEELVTLDQQENFEFIESEQEGEYFSVKGRRITKEPKLLIADSPAEEVLIDKDLVTLNLDDGDFVCHRRKRTFTDLRREGYSKADLDEVGTDDGYQWNDERVNRLFYDEESPDSGSDDDKSMRQFWVHECYVKVDYDGDGLAESRRIVMIGDKIFENEEDSYQPFCAGASIPIPGKHIGLSMLELTKDIQLINSTLNRNLLDNTYRINNNRKYVGEGALVDGGLTMDALLDATNEYIPVRDPMAIQPDATIPILADILPVIQHWTELRRMRTGVDYNMQMDSDVLQNTTAGAFMGALERSSKRIEAYTRTIAETVIKQLMRKVHRLCRQHLQKEVALKIRGQWVSVNPSEWRDRENLTVNVGLGTGSKDKKIGMLVNLLNIQKEAMQIDLAAPQHIYNTLEQLIEASDLKTVERYFSNPTMNPPKEQQPDPMMMAQVQALQSQSQALSTDSQVKAMRAQHEAGIKEREQSLKEREAAIREQQAELEARIKEMLAAVDVENKRMDTQHKQAQAMKAAEEARAQDIANDVESTRIMEGYYQVDGVADEQGQQAKADTDQ